MGRIVGRVLLAVLGLLVVGLFGLAVANAVEAGRRDRLYVDDRLGQAEKAGLAEAIKLKSRLGDEVWPGLVASDVPLILFNDRYEFLVGLDNPPPPWTLVEGDGFEGQSYYRREAARPVAFAVPIGARWAGSLGFLERMNREYLLGARSQLPPVIAQLFPYQFATLSRDMHVVLSLHEVFHAYQATLAPARFQRAERAYSLERIYPYDDKAFEEAWNAEGRKLAAALRATGDAEAKENARAFLQARESRRRAAALGPELVAYERELEWLEGLAKHVEIRFYEVAASRGSELGLTDYQPGLPYWQQEFARIDGLLGEQGGDFRFYLSGMAQARLLDRLSPGWTARVFSEDVSLEELLAEAVGGA